VKRTLYRVAGQDERGFRLVPLELGEREQYVEHQTSHGGGRVELLAAGSGRGCGAEKGPYFDTVTDTDPDPIPIDHPQEYNPDVEKTFR